MQTLSHEKYVVIKLPKKNQVIRRKLPITIGSLGNCDLIVHSPALGSFPRRLEANEDGLSIRSSRNFKPVSGPALKSFLQSINVKIRGPFEGHLNDSASKKILSECLQTENQLFERLPPKLRRWIGESLGQSYRLVSWVLAATVFYLTIQLISVVSSEPVKESLVEVPISLGQTIASTLGADSNHRAMAKGFILRASIPPEMANRALFLRFEYKGISEFSDLTLESSGKVLYYSPSNIDCYGNYCEATTYIPSKYTTSDQLLIQFARRHDHLAYRMKNIEIDTLKPMSSEQRSLAITLLKIAQRRYTERTIAHTNLLSARENASKLAGMLQIVEGEDDLKAEAQNLTRLISESWKKSIASLEFEAARHLKLGHKQEALSSYEAILKFYPDQNNPNYQRVRYLIDDLKGQK